MATLCPTLSHWRGNIGLGNWPSGQGFWKELPCGFLFPSPGDDGVAVVVQLLMPNSLQPCELQHVWPACPSLSPWVCSNSCPLSQWCYLTISSSVAPFSSCFQFFPASRSFPVSQFFISGGQSFGASAVVSVLPINIQGWCAFRLTGLISLLSKGDDGGTHLIFCPGFMSFWSIAAEKFWTQIFLDEKS